MERLINKYQQIINECNINLQFPAPDTEKEAIKCTKMMAENFVNDLQELAGLNVNSQFCKVRQ